jgi:hypothetical protein
MLIGDKKFRFESNGDPEAFIAARDGRPAGT